MCRQYPEGQDILQIFFPNSRPFITPQTPDDPRNHASHQSIHAKNEAAANLVSPFYDAFPPNLAPDDPLWSQRALTLAAWAFISIELNFPRAELAPLKSLVRREEQGVPVRDHLSWFAQLSLDLVMLSETSHHPTQQKHYEIKHRLRRTLALALDQCVYVHTLPKDLHALASGFFNKDDLFIIFGTDTLLHPSDFKQVRRSLERISAEGVNEASCLLYMLGVGSNESRHRWLERCRNDENSDQQFARRIALFLRAFMLDKDPSSGGSKRQLEQSLDWPLGIDPLWTRDQTYLDSIALSLCTKALCNRGGQRDELWKVSRQIVRQLVHSQNNHNLPKNAAPLLDSLDAIEICDVRACESIQGRLASESETHIYVTILAVMTGHSIESFWKWSLINWPIDRSSLNVIETELKCEESTEWTLSTIDTFVGPIFHAESKEASLVRVLQDAGLIRPTRGPIRMSYLHKLMFQEPGTTRSSDVPPRRPCYPGEIWRSRAQMLELIVANAIAARFHGNHWLRLVDPDPRAFALRAFNHAYQFRNRAGAHFSTQKASIGEALMWSRIIWRLIGIIAGGKYPL